MSLVVNWGDPPKPNIWRIEHTPVRRTLTAKSEKWVITSPLLRDKVTIYYRKKRKSFDVYTGQGLASQLVKGNDGDWDLDYILSNEWYMTHIKPLIDSGILKMNDKSYKVANEITVMWGDPPKPNLWKVVFIDGYGAKGDRWEVFSPIMEGCIEIVEHTLMFQYKYTESPLPDIPIFSIRKANIKGSSLNKALFSHKVWGEIKNTGFLKFNVDKVASLVSKETPLKAQWGSPPKPNLWKIRELFNNSLHIEITSPVMEGAIEIFQSSTERQVGTYYPNQMSGRGVVELFRINRRGFDHILSKQGYVEHILPLVEQGKIKLKGGMRIASSEVKLQWGNPPKPNVWKCRCVDMGEFLITSPLFKNSAYVEFGTTALEVKISRGYNAKNIFVPKATFSLGYISYRDGKFNKRVGIGTWYIEEVELKVSDLKVVQINEFAVIKSPIFWESAAKPALAVVSKIWKYGSLLTRKVATSSRFPDSLKKNSRKVTLNWGTPAKPNIWVAGRVKGRMGSLGEHFYYYIESPLLEDLALELSVHPNGRVEAFSVTNFYAGSRKKLNHVTLKDQKRGVAFTLEELDERVRSNDFWEGWMKPQLKQNGHLDNVKVARKL